MVEGDIFIEITTTCSILVACEAAPEPDWGLDMPLEQATKKTRSERKLASRNRNTAAPLP
jgi:hypothetical protein